MRKSSFPIRYKEFKRTSQFRVALGEKIGKCFEANAK